MIVLLALVTPAVIILGILSVGLYFSGRLLHPKTLTMKETLRRDTIAGKIKDEYNRLSWEEVYIDSPFRYRLHGIYFPVYGSHKAVVICHGITWTLHGSVKFVDMFHRLGFNVLLCDHRNHGKSGGTTTTYGRYEKYDVLAWVDWLEKICGPGCLTGVMGESMGAAVALQTCIIKPELAFCISDCTFSDLKDLLKYHIRKYSHLPGELLLLITGVLAYLRSGFRFSHASVKSMAPAIKVPVMLVHGNNDGYIPKEMSIELYNLITACPKKLYIAHKSGHVEAYWRNGEEYEQQVYDFLLAANIISSLEQVSG